ncbi:MAG: hypothetical protein H0T46_15680 [Deltaproteobacteria bacterium]|nr:hypothetical protein [Deltaproteobacteria bacterium]
MKLACVAALASIVIATGSAHAGSPDTSPPKDPNTALALSLGGSLVSVGLMGAGMARNDETGAKLFVAGLWSTVITPSLGHWYAGEVASTGFKIRLAGAAIVGVGLAQAMRCLFCEDEDRGLVAATIGGGIYAIGAIWEIADAPGAAERRNKRELQIAPAMVSTGAHPTLGVGIGGTF